MSASTNTKPKRGLDYDNMKCEIEPKDYDLLRDLPPWTMGYLIEATYRAVKRYFERPGVMEDYEKWLVEYRKTHPVEEENRAMIDAGEASC